MIGIVTQARMSSTRLPAKILKKINNKSLLQYHIERLQCSGFEVFVATTTNASDNEVVQFCEEHKIRFYRGSEDNVLLRFYELAKKFDLNTIVRVTSDCPLIDGFVIKKALDFYNKLSEKEDKVYLTNCQKRTFPRGFDFEIFSFSMLETMFKNAKQSFELEHVTPYIWKSHPEHFQIEHYTREEDASKFRLTVDEIDDFRLIEKLINDFKADELSAEEIIQILKSNSGLSKINQQVEQKKV